MQGQDKSFDIPLHDIKPIIDIPEYSFYYLLAASLFALMIVLGVIYLIYKWIKARNAFNIRRENIKIINSLDLSDTKHTAYIITSLGLIFKDDSPRHTEMYNNLVQRLEPYKYKKEVEKFDREVLGFIELYKGMIDV
ncbi:hypothetical protein [Sulfurimonas sp.]|uniref:hypothetical protein n=1 Tax=Sulfurimonas sp. TaxID=2022749 RepID=UPI0025DED4BD|nr:hypothetical protein [Sulfurimonas sp.]